MHSLAPSARDDFDSALFANNTGRFRSRFQSAVLWTGLACGTLVTLYRTDVLLLGAQSMKQESAYLELEKRWFGGAPGGTPREVRALTGTTTTQAAAAQPVATALAGASQAAPATGPDAPLPSAKSDSSESGDTLASAAKHDSTSDDDSKTEAAKAEATPATDRKPSSGSTTLAAAVKRSSPSPRPAPVKRSSASSNDDNDDPYSSSRAAAKREEVVDKPKRKEKPEPAEPMPAVGTEDFLKMSMRNAVAKSEKKKTKKRKKKASSTSYDPLNGDI